MKLLCNCASNREKKIYEVNIESAIIVLAYTLDATTALWILPPPDDSSIFFYISYDSCFFIVRRSAQINVCVCHIAAVMGYFYLSACARFHMGQLFGILFKIQCFYCGIFRYQHLECDGSPSVLSCVIGLQMGCLFYAFARLE